MKALVYLGPKKMEIQEWAAPEPGPGEVRVRSKFVGICGSDVHGFLGTTGRRTAPMVMGHEMSGTVDKKGAGVQGIPAGARVTVQPILNCGHCRYCEKGLINICQNRKFLGTMSTNGAFSEYFCVPAENICVLPENVSLEVGALVEPFAVAFRAVKHALPVEGKTVMVCGSGTIGLMILKVLKLNKAKRVVMVDLSDERLSLARRHGADDVVNPGTTPLDQALRDLGIRDDVEVSFEAVGVSPTVQQTVDFVQNCGQVIWVGNSSPMVSLNMQNVVTREVNIQGSYVYTGEDFRACVGLLSGKPQDFSGIISKIIPLGEATAAFDTLSEGAGSLIKVLVDLTA